MLDREHTKTGMLHDGFCQVEAWRKPGADYTIEVVRTTDAVSGLIWDSSTDEVCLVRQQRAAMVTDDNPRGITTELVAGRFDVKLGPQQLFAKECKEEADLVVAPECVLILNNGLSLASSPGILTECGFLAFVEIQSTEQERAQRYRPYNEMDPQPHHYKGNPDEGEVTLPFWIPADAFVFGSHQSQRAFSLAHYLKAVRMERIMIENAQRQRGFGLRGKLKTAIKLLVNSTRAARVV